MSQSQRGPPRPRTSSRRWLGDPERAGEEREGLRTLRTTPVRRRQGRRLSARRGRSARDVVEDGLFGLKTRPKPERLGLAAWRASGPPPVPPSRSGSTGALTPRPRRRTRQRPTGGPSRDVEADPYIHRGRARPCEPLSSVVIRGGVEPGPRLWRRARALPYPPSSTPVCGRPRRPTGPASRRLASGVDQEPLAVGPSPLALAPPTREVGHEGVADCLKTGGGGPNPHTRAPYTHKSNKKTKFSLTDY